MCLCSRLAVRVSSSLSHVRILPYLPPRLFFFLFCCRVDPAVRTEAVRHFTDWASAELRTGDAVHVQLAAQALCPLLSRDDYLDIYMSARIYDPLSIHFSSAGVSSCRRTPIMFCDVICSDCSRHSKLFARTIKPHTMSSSACGL